MLNNALAQDISTREEIYDFEIGDVFHVTSHFEAPDHEEDEVWNIQFIDKYEIQSLQLVYERAISQRSSVNGSPYEYIFYIDTIYIDNLDAPINGGNVSNVGTSPDLYNGRLINTYEYWIDPYSVDRTRWVNGCGRAYHLIWWEVDHVGWEIELVYYKKGEEEWGTPNIVGLEENRGTFQNLLNYPNPFTTSTNFEYTLEKPSDVTIIIYNSQGQVVDRMQEWQAKGVQRVEWSAEGLSGGMYYYRIMAEGKVGSGKLVISD